MRYVPPPSAEATADARMELANAPGVLIVLLLLYVATLR